MVISVLQPRAPLAERPEASLGTLVAGLRNQVLASGSRAERCHALFFDERRCYLGDCRVGTGSFSALCLRMREIFSEALRLDARGLIIAHNHPSGHCRPSGCDIVATHRLSEIAQALDIELIDHLIFTEKAVYSMRAGGLL